MRDDKRYAVRFVSCPRQFGSRPAPARGFGFEFLGWRESKSVGHQPCPKRQVASHCRSWNWTTLAVPEVFRSHGFVFFFYANEGNEPMHVHVRKAGGFAKFWLEPVELDYAQGMKVADLSRAEELIRENIELIRRKWHEVHGS